MSAANATRWAARLAALDANLLVALDALLTESSVTRAARRMGVTQPAMSQTLGRLRNQFDDPILVRVGRHMEPTPFAQRIAAPLREAIRGLESVLADRPGFDPASTPRRFVLAMVDYLSLVHLPPLRARIAEEAPHVDLAVRGLDAASIAAELEGGAVDLYIGIRGETERGLNTARLYEESFQVLTRPDHPLLEEPSAEAYAGWPHVHVSPRREAGSVVERALAAEDLERRVALEVPYFGLLPRLLDGTDLVATVPGRLARMLATEHGLAVIEPPIALPRLTIHAAWHPRLDGEPGLAWLRSRVLEISRDTEPP